MTSVYTFDDTQLLQQVNYTKGILVDSMRREGFITDDQAAELHTHYSMIIENKSWVPDFLAKFLSLKDDSIRVRLVRAIGREKQ